MKKKLTLSILALVALTLMGCGDNNSQNQNRVRFVDQYTIYTDTVRGHVYLYIGGGGILHDPDCPCQEKGGIEQ